MRSTWKAVMLCGAVAWALGSGTAIAGESAVCSLPAAEAVAAVPGGLEQAPVFVDTPAWCCLNGYNNTPCVESTVEACAAAGYPSYPFFLSCQRRTSNCDETSWIPPGS